MKKSIPLHGIWLVVAVAAFAAGKFVFPSAQSERDSADDSSAVIGKLASRGDDANGPGKKKAGDEDEEEGAGELTAFDESGAAELKTRRELSEEQMREAILKAIHEPNPVKSNLLFAQLLDQLTPENVEAAIETFRENANDPSMFRQMGLFTYAWGAMDGAKAVDYAQSLDGRGAVFGTSSALSGWASSDPEAAIEWLDGQEVDGMEKSMYARGLINGLAQTDLKLATEFALSVDDKEMQFQFFDVIAREQMEKGIDSASAWISTLPDVEAQKNALYNISRQYARQDLDAAADWVLQYANEPFGANAVGEVADELAERDPAEAIKWVSTLPDGEAQQRGMAATLREWGRSDPTGASEYLNTMPDSEAKDRAVSSFAQTVSREDTESALAWATTIADPQIREETTIRVGQDYFRQDPAGAQQWVTTSGLSAEAQQQVTNPPRRDSPFGGFGRGRGPGGGGGPPGFDRRR